MGATEFITLEAGKYASASEAFRRAQERARYEYGHGGYTGTIAEKSGFRMMEVSGDPIKFARKMASSNSKWDPAFAIELKGVHLKRAKEKFNLSGKRGIRAFLFFGLASE